VAKKLSENEQRITRSVLDRLIDLEPGAAREAAKSHAVSLREMKQSVRRDLEWLLNTRCHMNSLDEKLEEAPRSVAFYGLPDFTGISAQSSAEKGNLIKSLESAIRNFEPRFLNVTVSMEPLSALDRQLRFHIEAHLDMDPMPEPIAFDTVLRLGNGEFAVREI